MPSAKIPGEDLFCELFMARALKQLQQLGSVFATSWSWRQYRILQPEPMADPFFYWWQTLGLVIQSHIFIQAGVTGWLSDQDQSETKYLVIRFSIWILSQLLSVKCCTFTQKAMRRADHFKTLPFSQISTENVEGIFLSLTREHSFPTTSVARDSQGNGAGRRAVRLYISNTKV